MTRLLAVLAIVLSTVGCDRATKHLATISLAGLPARSYLGDTVWLGYIENPGAFLSLGAHWPDAWRTLIFTGGTGLMLVALAIAVVRMRCATWPLIGATLFFAGGVSNWFDRATRGAVVDFVSVGIGPLRTGVFNVADVALLFGAGLFLAGEFLGAPRIRPPDVAD